MPLSDEFRRHFHELMVETSLGLKDELNQHQRENVWKAQQTNNAAAVPIAYSEAAIHAFRTRVEAITTRYMEALENCHIEVDDNDEKEILQRIGALTSAKHPLSLPPAAKHHPNAAAVQRAHMMELSRVGTLLYRKAANRLREAKMEARNRPRRSPRKVQCPVPSHSRLLRLRRRSPRSKRFPRRSKTCSYCVDSSTFIRRCAEPVDCLKETFFLAAIPMVWERV
jgi:hypothetical protein